jgi:hypothetical protein
MCGNRSARIIAMRYGSIEERCCLLLLFRALEAILACNREIAQIRASVIDTSIIDKNVNALANASYPANTALTAAAVLFGTLSTRDACNSIHPC